MADCQFLQLPPDFLLPTLTAVVVAAVRPSSFSLGGSLNAATTGVVPSLFGNGRGTRASFHPMFSTICPSLVLFDVAVST